MLHFAYASATNRNMDEIRGLPTTPEGEINLELQGETVIVERRLFGIPATLGRPAERDRKVRIHVPAAALRRLLEKTP